MRRYVCLGEDYIPRAPGRPLAEHFSLNVEQPRLGCRRFLDGGAANVHHIVRGSGAGTETWQSANLTGTGRRRRIAATGRWPWAISTASTAATSPYWRS